MKKILTKEITAVIKEALIDVALIEINIVDSDKYWEVANKLEENEEVIISDEDANVIFECIYKYIEYKKIKDIDNYIEIIRTIIEIE